MNKECNKLLPSGSEQHKVLRDRSIPLGILLFRRQSSRSLFRWLKTCSAKTDIGGAGAVGTSASMQIRAPRSSLTSRGFVLFRFVCVLLISNVCL